MINITEIIVAIIGLLSALVTAFLVPYLKTKINAERWKQIQEITFVAVSAAEQLGITGKIADKYSYASAQVKTELDKLGLKYDESVIKDAIEAAVRQNFPNK